MDKDAWWATVHRVTKSQARLKRLSMHICMRFVVKQTYFPSSLPPSLPKNWQGSMSEAGHILGCKAVGLPLLSFFLPQTLTEGLPDAKNCSRHWRCNERCTHHTHTQDKYPFPMTIKQGREAMLMFGSGLAEGT